VRSPGEALFGKKSELKPLFSSLEAWGLSVLPHMVALAKDLLAAFASFLPVLAFPCPPDSVKVPHGWDVNAETGIAGA
jgi:hypothetical protein